MMPVNVTLWDLVVDGRIAIEEIAAAVDTYLAAPMTREHPLGPAYSLDLAAAIAAHATAPGILADTEMDEPSRRIAVRAAILMAEPVGRPGR